MNCYRCDNWPCGCKDGQTIIHGDCREVLPQLEKESVTCIVTSPPYNQRLNKFKPSGMHKETRWVGKISDGYFDDLPESEYQKQQIEVLNHLHRVATNDGSIFYNHKNRWRDGKYISPLSWLMRCDWKMRQDIVWSRNGSCTLNAKMFAPSDERIYWLVKGKHKWNQSSVGHLTVWNLNSKPDSAHPCAYPLSIPKRCIEATTNEDDTVLDPYLGSGTTLRAAKDLGRKGIGIEGLEKYCELAAKRLEQGVLFGIESDRDVATA